MLHFNLLDTQAGRDVYQMGLREGFEKGFEKGKQFILKQMLGKGLELRDIAELTQLPDSEIVKLCCQSEDNNKQ